MRGIFTVLIVSSLLFFTRHAYGQCTFDGTDANVTQAEVIACVNACSSGPCNEIWITGVVNMDGDWNLTSLGNIILRIKVGGQLVFSGSGTMAADVLTLTAGSIVIIEDTNPANNALLQTGGGGNVRITIGGASYKGQEFPGIITAGGVDVNGVLPVELTRFEAQPKDNMIQLAWTTASELNNDFFQVEHSRDGITFFSVGKVKGVGTTSETVHYDFTHRQPIAGTNYYRLKQVDFDGAFEYSGIVVADLQDRSGGVQVFPNPAVNQVTIRMPDRPENLRFQLTNLLGQQIDRPSVPNGNNWDLDLSGLAKGIYLLRIEFDGKVLVKRLVKE